MSDLNDLDLKEQLMTQLEEMQSEIEQLTEQIQSLQKDLGEKETVITEQQSRISSLQNREADYRKALKKVTADADDGCRKMQQKMNAAEQELTEMKVAQEQPCDFSNSRTHIYIWIIVAIAIYASVMTLFTIILT